MKLLLSQANQPNTMTAESKTLATLEVGDQVIINKNQPSCEVVVVEKVSKREIKAGGRRWLKSDGNEVGSAGDAWSLSPWIAPATPELLAVVAAKERRRRVYDAVRGLLKRLGEASQDIHPSKPLDSSSLNRLEAAIPHLQAALAALTEENK